MKTLKTFRLAKLSITALLSTFVLMSLCANSYAWRPISSNKLPKTAKSFAGIYPEYPKIDYGTGEKAKLLQRGEYLSHMADCIACHSDTGKGGKPFAGGYPIKTPFGTFYSPNITPDKKTGIGSWTEKDFIRAMRDGKAPDGSNYFPVFPYLYFTKMSDDDLRALFAYLKAIPAVENKNKKPDVPFPFNVRFAQYGWKILFFYPHNDRYKYDSSKSPEWNRGAYIVQGAGHCAMCHTPLNPLGAPKRKYNLTGTFIDGYWAPNITGEGLKDSSIEAIVKVFKEDELLNAAGDVAGPMREVNHNSLGQMTDKDLHAIAVYLKSVESVQPMAMTGKNYHEVSLRRGKEVYNQACTVCHQEGQAGAPMIGDGANYLERLHARHYNGLVRNVINGYNNMPIRGGCVNCNDTDIESAVLYLLHESLNRDQYKHIKNPKPKPQPTEVQAAKIYKDHCAVCHDKGELGAPKIGDQQAWKPRIEKNMDVLIHNTMIGLHNKPPKGGCKYCSTTEVIAAVKYMVQKSKAKGDYTLW